MRLAIAIVLTIVLASVGTAARVECAASDINWTQALTLLQEMDDSRKNMKVLADNSGHARDKLAWRIAHDDVELAMSYYGTVQVLLGLRSKMTHEADRLVFDPWIEKTLKNAIDSFDKNADFLTTLTLEPNTQAFSAEATVLRDKARHMVRLLTCAP